MSALTIFKLILTRNIMISQKMKYTNVSTNTMNKTTLKIPKSKQNTK